MFEREHERLAEGGVFDRRLRLAPAPAAHRVAGVRRAVAGCGSRGDEPADRFGLADAEDMNRESGRLRSYGRHDTGRVVEIARVRDKPADRQPIEAAAAVIAHRNKRAGARGRVERALRLDHAEELQVGEQFPPLTQRIVRVVQRQQCPPRRLVGWHIRRDEAVGGPATGPEGYPIAQRTPSPLDQLLRLFAPATAEAHGATADLWIVNADGTGLRRLTKINADTPMAVFSPGGREIALMGAGGIYLMNADGANLRKIDALGDHGGLDWAGR